MFSNFFIKRPIFAIVVSLVIIIAGLLSMFKLPIEQYPNMTPVQITVSATYPGADAQTVAETVAAPIETQINGVDNMIYMTSTSSSGSLTITVYFGIGTDPDIAQVQVQNRVNIAESQLPSAVTTNGLTIEKRSSSILMLVGIIGTDNRYTKEYVANYANVYVLDAIKRVPGAGQAAIIGASDQAMRIWLNPDRMASLGITTSDVSTAVASQNSRFASGSVGAAPSTPKTDLTFPVLAPEPSADPTGYENMVLRTDQKGAAVVYLRDVADVEVGQRSYDVDTKMDNSPASFIAVYQQAGANALDVANSMYETLNTLQKQFPEGIEYKIAVDTTYFVRLSIDEVIKTLFEAAVLVILVVYVFLQSVKTTIIACTAIIVALTGAFIGMYLLDFSINILTLFGLVLAIGLVVDDAIVVVENVERNMSEKRMNPIAATELAMSEVSGPIIATVLVLSSVFIPAGFIGGTTGQLYKQFAITIAISVIFSGFVALSLTPALCGAWLEHEKPINRGSLAWVNKFVVTITKGYGHWTRWLYKVPWFVVLCFLLICAAIFGMFRITPTGFVPSEDQGYLMAAVIMPSSASLNRTDDMMDGLNPHFQKIEGVKNINSLAGFSILDGGTKTNAGTYFMLLNPFAERYKNSDISAKESADAILADISRIGFTTQMQGLVVPINPPAIPGLGTTGGFEFWIQDTTGGPIDQLQNVVDKFIAKAKENPALTSVTTTFSAIDQQLKLKYDRDKSELLGLSTTDVFDTLQAQFGSSIVSQYSQYSRVWYVIMQASPQFRATPEDIQKLYVRNTSGDMIPLSSVVTASYTNGPTFLPHYNGFPAAQVIGNSAAGFSSGDAITALKEIAAEVLPTGFIYGWSGISYEEQSSASSSAVVFAFGLLLVFLVLAAQYESWALPCSVILAVPFGIIGSLLFTWLRGLENDVYFQIGMLVLIGLAAKNAILIVEFAVELRRKGLDLPSAAIYAGEIRFRPIIMTSLAFIGGMIPLAIATGAGAESRHSIGTGIIGGMIALSSFALLFVPIFYIWFEGWAENVGAKRAIRTSAKLAERELPITEKLRLAILNGGGGIYDVDAKVTVTPKGQVTITNSPGFSVEQVENADYGLPGQEAVVPPPHPNNETQVVPLSGDISQSALQSQPATGTGENTAQGTANAQQTSSTVHNANGAQPTQASTEEAKAQNQDNETK
ncbi:MAG: multidrug efflux RND transporter permease subunit [Burkholderiales bacterium]|nr:multidrug efflux RND transporter permease subunit [Burkholderiales bacterium]